MRKILSSKTIAHFCRILTRGTRTYLRKIRPNLGSCRRRSCRPPSKQFPLDTKSTRPIFRLETKIPFICMVWKPKIENNRQKLWLKLIYRKSRLKSRVPSLFKNTRGSPHQGKMLPRRVRRPQLPFRLKVIIIRLTRKRPWERQQQNQMLNLSIKRIRHRSIFKFNNNNTRLTAKTYNSVNLNS